MAHFKPSKLAKSAAPERPDVPERQVVLIPAARAYYGYTKLLAERDDAVVIPESEFPEWLERWRREDEAAASSKDLTGGLGDDGFDSSN